MARIEPDNRIPDFSLPDQNGDSIDPAAIAGKLVLFSFHPLAWTGICQRQMEALEMNADAFAALDAVAFGVSVDPVPSKKAWADSLRIEKTKLLSDFWPHGASAASLGLFRDADGFSERAAVIADRKGIVRFVKVYPIGEAPDLGELMDKLKKLNN
jgi:peroxiredoxin